MKYTVVWTDIADNELCELYLSVPNRAEFVRIVDAIESELARRPEAVGESRDQDWRVVMESHIGMIFEINPGDLLVQVLHIGWLP